MVADSDEDVVLMFFIKHGIHVPDRLRMLLRRANTTAQEIYTAHLEDLKGLGINTVDEFRKQLDQLRIQGR